MSEKTLYDRVVEAFQKEKRNPTLIKKEWFELQPKLVICGGGHVAMQVAKFAKALDFYVQVIDDREEFANQKCFPEVDEICCHTFDELQSIFPKEKNTYFVVVTRGHAADLTCVEQILKRPFAYLGMIGSKIKVAKTFELLREKDFTEEKIQQIHAPIGLKIQAQTPAEIAISILAEIIQCKNSREVSTMTANLLKTDGKGVLCIIIEKTGSSPRNVGSMMFVKEDGTTIGSVGGGAVENAVIHEAQAICEITEKSYSMSQKESAGLGMICGGMNRFLMIPITS